MHIGVLDNNPAMCHFLEAALIAEGHRVFLSTDPLCFLSVVGSCRRDYWACLLVGFSLPGDLLGTEIIRQVRQQHPHLPAILISANDISQKRLESLSPVGVFQKPFYLSKLFALLENMTAYERIRAFCERQRHQCEQQHLWITEQRLRFYQRQVRWEQRCLAWEQAQANFASLKQAFRDQQSQRSLQIPMCPPASLQNGPRYSYRETAMPTLR